MGREKDRKDLHTEALRREASDLRTKAREANAKGTIEWKDMHAKLREAYGQMDEWERKARAHRVNRPEEGIRNIEYTVKRQEIGTSVQVPGAVRALDGCAKHGAA